MQNTEVDTTAAETVAPTTKKSTYPAPVGVLKRFDAIDSRTLTDVEAFTIRALRDWQRAEDDPAYRRRMDAWEDMRAQVELVRGGLFTREEARLTVGNEAALPYFLMVSLAAELHEWFAEKMYRQPGDNTIDEAVQSYSDFDAWQLLHSETGKVLRGEAPAGINADADPELYAICYALKAWIQKRRAGFVANLGEAVPSQEQEQETVYDHPMPVQEAGTFLLDMHHRIADAMIDPVAFRRLDQLHYLIKRAEAVIDGVSIAHEPSDDQLLIRAVAASMTKGESTAE